MAGISINKTDISVHTNSSWTTLGWGLVIEERWGFIIRLSIIQGFLFIIMGQTYGDHYLISTGR